MSERSRYPSRSSLLASLLEGRCQFWPRCECARCLDNDQLYRAVVRLADEHFPAPTKEEIENIEVKVYLVLSCVSANCPEARVRRYASVELMKPFYDRQRAIDMKHGWRGRCH